MRSGAVWSLGPAFCTPARSPQHNSVTGHCHPQGVSPGDQGQQPSLTALRSPCHAAGYPGHTWGTGAEEAQIPAHVQASRLEPQPWSRAEPGTTRHPPCSQGGLSKLLVEAPDHPQPRTPLRQPSASAPRPPCLGAHLGSVPQAPRTPGTQALRASSRVPRPTAPRSHSAGGCKVLGPP